MTYKEAFDIISSNYCIGCEHCNPKDCGECSGSWSMLEALVNDADKYRWHDLRKNPEDLPPIGYRILFCTNDCSYWTGLYDGTDYRNDDHEGYVTQFIYSPSEVIAWREIEPFEKEEEKMEERNV